VVRHAHHERGCPSLSHAAQQGQSMPEAPACPAAWRNRLQQRSTLAPRVWPAFDPPGPGASPGCFTHLENPARAIIDRLPRGTHNLI
jgi:hypothetical protein